MKAYEYNANIIALCESNINHFCIDTIRILPLCILLSSIHTYICIHSHEAPFAHPPQLCLDSTMKSLIRFTINKIPFTISLLCWLNDKFAHVVSLQEIFSTCVTVTINQHGHYCSHNIMTIVIGITIIACTAQCSFTLACAVDPTHQFQLAGCAHYTEKLAIFICASASSRR